MRPALISHQNSVFRNVFGVVLILTILPILLVVKLILMPFERPVNRSPDEVVQYLRDFLNGTGSDGDWDAFISIPIADPRLEDIRERAASLDLPIAATDTGLMEVLIADAEALAADGDRGI